MQVHRMGNHEIIEFVGGMSHGDAGKTEFRIEGYGSWDTLEQAMIASATRAGERPEPPTEIGVAQAITAEREACAALIESMGRWCGGHGEPSCPTPSDYADAIRARSGAYEAKRGAA